MHRRMCPLPSLQAASDFAYRNPRACPNPADRILTGRRLTSLAKSLRTLPLAPRTSSTMLHAWRARSWSSVGWPFILSAVCFGGSKLNAADSLAYRCAAPDLKVPDLLTPEPLQDFSAAGTVLLGIAPAAEYQRIE